MEPIIGCVVCLPLVLLFFLRFYLAGHVTCKTDNRLDDKVIIVTGATSGIGRATASACARRGAKVILACRDKVKAEATVTSIRRRTTNENVHFLPLDLASFQGVRDFVAIFCKQFGQLDVLVNNAAYMGPQAKTVDGLDRTLQVNYLGHFLLTVLLAERFTRADSDRPLRVINLSSDGYKKGQLDFDDLMYAQRKYDIYGAYGASKLAVMLSTMELGYRYAGHGVVCMAVQPGATNTNLLRDWPGMPGNFLRFFAKLFFRSAEGGAQSILYCAAVDDTEQLVGKLVYDCRPLAVEPRARDYRAAERLWQLSLNLCNVELTNQKA